MTLSYWWMHWFWITLRICVSEVDVTHSTFPNSSDFNEKDVGTSITNPPITLSPSNLTAITKKPSFKKFNANMTKSTNKTFSASKDTAVINQNLTDLDNGTFSAINHTDVLNYVNQTTFNQSFLISYEKTIENSEDFSDNLSAAGITGITLGCVIIVGVICGVSYFFYRNRGFNRPQVLNDRCSNPDSSGYLDDASVRDNSEEMYSLDNDSFLNSLEAMTIQNYWTDTVKHTKL